MRPRAMIVLGRAVLRPLLLGAALAAGGVAPASASCDITGIAISSQCDGTGIVLQAGPGGSSLTVSDQTTEWIDIGPATNGTTPTSQTLHVTGATVVRNLVTNTISSSTTAADHDLSVIIDSGVEIYAVGVGQSAISLLNGTSGDLSIINAGELFGDSGIEAVTASGSVDITNTGSIFGMLGNGVTLVNASLTNSGIIAIGGYGVDMVGSGNRLTTSGLISGGMAAVHFGGDGNSLNILEGATFSGLVDYAGTAGNTTSFGTGSYTVPAANYLDTSNRIVLSNASQVVVLDQANTMGTINVVAVTPASQAASQFTASVSDVVGGILSLDVARPDPGTVGDMPALRYGEEKAETTEAKALRQLGDGVAIDGHGNLFWARAFGGLRYQPAGDGDLASHTSHYGVVSGVDHQFENHRVGVLAGGGNVRTVTSDSASIITGNTGFAGVYGAVTLDGLQWNASLTGGIIDNRSSRAVYNNDETASGDFMGWYVSPELSVSSAYQIAPRWQLTPSAKIRYTGAFYDAYDESGSSQNVSYDARETHALDGRLQVELKHQMVLPSGLPASFSATAALADTQYLGSGDTHASFLNDEFTVSSSGDSNVVGASLGVGFDAMISEQATVYGSVDGTLYSDDSMAASGRLGLKLAF
ncbi:MAG: autotransporter protein [Proteobacteria bacterium]|nr:autotransporter protein [Pseudomonadota bacterium]